MLRGAKVGGEMSLDGSDFEKTVSGYGLSVEQSLFLSARATFKGDVALIGAKVGGQMSLDGFDFEKAVNGHDMTVGRSVFSNLAAFKPPGDPWAAMEQAARAGSVFAAYEMGIKAHFGPGGYTKPNGRVFFEAGEWRYDLPSYEWMLKAARAGRR
jgi:hypothetical protein